MRKGGIAVIGERIKQLRKVSSLVAQVVKNLPANSGDPGSIPGLERYPGEEHGNPLQRYCLENSMDGGAWQTTVFGVTRGQIQLSN